MSGLTNSASVKAHLLTGGVDEVFLRLEGNAGASLQSVVSDINNNTLALLDATQRSITNYTYEPYGATTSDAANSNAQQYAGRENDNPGNGQGLYYYRARYYMPQTGRFISSDPIGWASGQTNNYAYVAGDPIGFRDPLGLDDLPGEDFSAGLGDVLTLGATRGLRDLLGIDGVNTSSGWYIAGEIAPMAVAPMAAGSVATAGVVGAEAIGGTGVAVSSGELGAVIGWGTGQGGSRSGPDRGRDCEPDA